jgi:hypothetical protein
MVGRVWFHVPEMTKCGYNLIMLPSQSVGPSNGRVLFHPYVLANQQAFGAQGLGNWFIHLLPVFA